MRFDGFQNVRSLYVVLVPGSRFRANNLRRGIGTYFSVFSIRTLNNTRIFTSLNIRRNKKIYTVHTRRKKSAGGSAEHRIFGEIFTDPGVGYPCQVSVGSPIEWAVVQKRAIKMQKYKYIFFFF